MNASGSVWIVGPPLPYNKVFEKVKVFVKFWQISEWLVTNLQATSKDHQLYRKQRSQPQVIVPETDHKVGYEITDHVVGRTNSRFAIYNTLLSVKHAHSLIEVSLSARSPDHRQGHCGLL
jgi:hypothetical protein